MRLAGQSKLGYFPAPADAIAGICKHLAIMPGKPADDVHIIDPCAGEGRAIQQFSEALGLAQDNVYAVELDSARADACRANMPTANVLGPASAFGAHISPFSMGLAYVNPPFDSELGGGRREEQGFTDRATYFLPPGGILVLVCPLTALFGNRNFVEFLDSRFEDIRVWKFPDHCRPYREIAVIGKKRKVPLPKDALYKAGNLHKMEATWRNVEHFWFPKLQEVGSPHYTPYYGGYAYDREDCPVYLIPTSFRARVFKKVSYTDAELAEALERSPLNALLREIQVPPPRQPPLPLSRGHVALLLAAGMLDGIVDGPDGPHVVRGTAKKVEYISGRSSIENEETGAVTEKVVYSQKIVLTIRAVGDDGAIRTFSDEPRSKEEGEAAEEAQEGEDEAA